MADARRTAEELREVLGRDLRLSYRLSGGFYEEADVVARRGAGPSRTDSDLEVADGVDNLAQALANRLKTRRGELTALGHPEYGSRHHELMGEPNVERTRNLVKLYVLQALRHEPRVEEVLSATVRPEHDPPRETVRIELELRVLDRPDPLNLVLPFALEGGA